MTRFRSKRWLSALACVLVSLLALAWWGASEKVDQARQKEEIQEMVREKIRQFDREVDERAEEARTRLLMLRDKEEADKEGRRQMHEAQVEWDLEEIRQRLGR